MKARFAVAAAVLVVVTMAAFLVRLATNGLPSAKPTGCAVDGTTFRFTTEQASNAATIGAVGLRRGLPERAVVVALATAMQESRLRNLDYGDRDSLGLFQQRPSQGWGQPAQVMDPRYAAGKFYEALVEVRGWETMPLTEAAQAVQKSGFPDAYARWEARADALAGALVGGQVGGLKCAFPKSSTGSRDAAGGSSESRAAAVVTELGRDFPDSQQVGGRAATVEVTPANWATANWLVANAERLGLESVSFADRTWTRGRGNDGWRGDRDAPDDRIRATVTAPA